MNAQLASDRVITLRLRALADSLPAVLEAEPDGVHKARVASRRVREALPVVLAQAPPGRAARLRRSFRRVTRALGPLREIDVTLQLLDQAAPDDADAGPVIQELQQRLEREREARREQMLARLDAIDFESLVGRIERLMDDRADETDEARALPAAIAGTLGLRIARRVRAVERAIELAGGLYAVESLHRVRIAIKKLRYALELAYEMKQLRSRRPITVLREAQAALGHLHDEQVLAGWMRRAGADQAAGGAISGALDRLETSCRAHHARYIALRPKLLAAAEQALDAMTPTRGSESHEVEASVTVH
jgi:CHAD domain-containing protein